MILAMLSLGFVTSVTQADYIKPETLIEISPGVNVRSVAAQQIIKYNLTDVVSALYKKSIPEIGKKMTHVQTPDDCISLFINTRDGKKNFINQISVDDNDDCSNKYLIIRYK